MVNEDSRDFDDAFPVADDEAFVVDVDGWEGPIDLLLALARDQKVDLIHVSIVQLADQYLDFVARVRRANLELAADYLVMAAWLAYLKSRLLLPAPATGEEPSGEEMAAALTFQLQRLEAMQEAGARLMARPRLGQEVFARGTPESLDGETRTVIEVGLYDLLAAYAEHKNRQAVPALRIEASGLDSVDAALTRIRAALGGAPDWESLWMFLPPGTLEGLRTGQLRARSALAATFAASLELAREGRARIRQPNAFGPIYVRRAEPERHE